MDSNEPHVIGSLIRTAAEWQISLGWLCEKFCPAAVGLI